jgi:hypothetical protein
MYGWKYDIKTNLREVRCKVTKWSELAQRAFRMTGEISGFIT